MPDRSPSRRISVFAAVMAIGASVAGAAAGQTESQQLPVPKVTLYPGDPIGAEMLILKAFPARLDLGAVTLNPEALIGKVARRTLIAGKPIPPTYIRDREVIQKGKPVRVVFSEGGLTISSVAVPLQAGGVGDVLSLRNVDSGTVIKGIVEPDGSIRIAGP